MVVNKDILAFPISLLGIYIVILCGIGSLGTSMIVFQKPIRHLLYRFFFYQEPFSHVVVAYLLYSFRKLELLLGSELYLSLWFTLFLLLTPWLFLFSSFFSKSDSCVLYCSSILMIFLRCVPSLTSSSIVLYKSFSISQHVLLLFILLLLALHNSIVGMIEMVLGIVIGRVSYTYIISRHKVIPFPPFITKILIALVRLFFSSSSTQEDSEAPLVYGDRIMLSEEEDPLREEDIQALMNLGFSRMECICALRDRDYDVNAAAEQLLATV